MLDLLYENLVSIVAALIGLVLAFAIVCYLFPTIARIVLKGFLYISILLFFGSLGSDFISTGINFGRKTFLIQSAKAAHNNSLNRSANKVELIRKTCR